MRVGLGVAASEAAEALTAAGGAAEASFGPLEPPVMEAIARAILGATGLEVGSSDAAGTSSAPDGAGASSAPDARADTGGPMTVREIESAVRRAERENYQVVNVDVTVSVSPAVEAFPTRDLRYRVAEVVHTAPDNVSVQRSGAPGLLSVAGFVTAVAVVLVDQIRDIDVVHAAMRSGG